MKKDDWLTWVILSLGVFVLFSFPVVDFIDIDNNYDLRGFSERNVVGQAYSAGGEQGSENNVMNMDSLTVACNGNFRCLVIAAKLGGVSMCNSLKGSDRDVCLSVVKKSVKEDVSSGSSDAEAAENLFDFFVGT